MSVSLNISDVITYVRNIIDSVRCTACDKADGGRIRYPCGHSSCDDCQVKSGGCMLCLTPPFSLSNPRSDDPHNQRVKNACDLLNACQDAFNLDVYRRLRISEQLRAEKDFFPECIQAPAKYCNKRKSASLLANKENFNNSYHLGENITYTDSFKMKRCQNYVQQWLEKSEIYPRKALTDLPVNKNNAINNTTLQYKSNKNNVKQINRNASNIHSLNVKSRKRPCSPSSVSLLSRENSVFKLNAKKSKDSFCETPLLDDKKEFEHTDNEESGIVLDDEPILIEDSQSEVIDKDKLALLAVQAAEREKSDYVSLKSTQDIELPPALSTQLSQRKEKYVSFYKKSSLAGCCFYCNFSHKTCNKTNDNNVSITIENQQFITIIKVTKCAEVIHNKKTAYVQTHFEKENVILEENNKKDMPDTTADMSMDMLQFKRSHDVPENNNILKKKGIIIEDSDSDDSCLEGSFMQVTAEVHRSCEPVDYGILSEITELPHRKKKKRCITPDSNNSSEKENYDPNKCKKKKFGKKSKNSKKLHYL